MKTVRRSETEQQSAARRAITRSSGAETSLGPVTGIGTSPRLSAQRKSINGAFGETAQLRGSDEEELLQGKVIAGALQRKGPGEEELP